MRKRRRETGRQKGKERQKETERQKKAERGRDSQRDIDRDSQRETLLQRDLCWRERETSDRTNPVRWQAKRTRATLKMIAPSDGSVWYTGQNDLYLFQQTYIYLFQRRFVYSSRFQQRKSYVLTTHWSESSQSPRLFE